MKINESTENDLQGHSDITLAFALSLFKSTRIFLMFLIVLAVSSGEISGTRKEKFPILLQQFERKHSFWS